MTITDIRCPEVSYIPRQFQEPFPLIAVNANPSTMAVDDQFLVSNPAPNRALRDLQFLCKLRDGLKY